MRAVFLSLSKVKNKKILYPQFHQAIVKSS